uniref:PRKG1_interact domain-containing protein n=1 Tax=Steinernema glaseri TaxID=37863 RepID=A0A1I8A3I4_9BILA
MDPNCIFRLTRTSLYQIPDLSDYFKLDYGTRAREMTIDTSRAHSPRDDASTSRLSRSSSRAFSSNRMSQHTRHHSLIAMRTHYAYGARSASLSSNAGRYYSTASSRYPSNEPLHKTYEPPSVLSNYKPSYSSYYRTLPVSSTNSAITYGKRSHYSPSTYSGAYHRLSYSSTGNYTPTYTKNSTLPRNYRSSAASPTHKNYSRLSPVATSATESSATIPEIPTVLPKSPSVCSIPEKVLVEKYVQTLRTGEDVPPKAVAEPSSSHLKAAQSELLFLRQENERLRKEMAELKDELKQKERQDIETKRRLLETEAEMKVWKNKCEADKPTVVEIREPPQNGLPSELIDQLDSAADRLHKLNAVKDLKLLQKEMESALLEIAHK